MRNKLTQLLAHLERIDDEDTAIIGRLLDRELRCHEDSGAAPLHDSECIKGAVAQVVERSLSM